VTGMLARKVQRAAGRYLERALLTLPFQSDQPQLFILGLPRSGTTLVYQYVVHCLKVAYFTNGVERARWYPCLMTAYQRQRYGDYHSDFKSRYGQVDGPVAPHEAGGVWGRFFDNEAYERYADLTPEKLRLLRRTVFCVQRNAPFVNKNVKHLLRIDALARAFPNVRFLVVERNLADVGVSVLRGRYKNQGNAAAWWSARPANYEALKDLPPAEQVTGQVIALRERMEQDLAMLPPERVLRVGYEDFCRQPEMLIERLQEAIGPVETRNPPKVSFAYSVNKPETAEERRVVELVQR
jgi:Sulfotransferase family